MSSMHLRLIGVVHVNEWMSVVDDVLGLLIFENQSVTFS